ncbi:hypothetical protein NDU88_004660, partial [Pleurodeles waltl]
WLSSNIRAQILAPLSSFSSFGAGHWAARRPKKIWMVNSSRQSLILNFRDWSVKAVLFVTKATAYIPYEGLLLTNHET